MVYGRKFLPEWYVLSVVRIIIGITVISHGAQKLLGAFGGIGGHGMKPPPFSLFWFAGVIETIGGLLIILGLFTQPVALLLCGEMAVAYFMVHAPRGLWPIINGGELAVLYCFIFLYLFAAGPGAFSLDSVI